MQYCWVPQSNHSGPPYLWLQTFDLDKYAGRNKKYFGIIGRLKKYDLLKVDSMYPDMVAYGFHEDQKVGVNFVGKNVIASYFLRYQFSESSTRLEIHRDNGPACFVYEDAE